MKINNPFLSDLKTLIKTSVKNDYGLENFDKYRFNSIPVKKQKSKYPIKTSVLRMIEKYFPKVYAKYKLNKYSKYFDGLNSFYLNLDQSSKKLLLDVIAFRILGYKKVKIDGQAVRYLEYMDSYQGDFSSEEIISSTFEGFHLKHFDIRNLGYNINLFSIKIAIIIDFLIEQYSLSNNEYHPKISAESGDTVLDLGACWGDTSLYFAEKVGESGKVYAFEFIPSNLKILNRNLELNQDLRNRIKVISDPVSDTSNKEFYYLDRGPASRVSNKFSDGLEGPIYSVSIDKTITKNGINSVDLIKMDIEGAELVALKGAEQTIRNFRPKLMIALYHSIDDFVDIPKYLNSLNLNYSFHLGHFTIHSEETILFAYPK